MSTVDNPQSVGFNCVNSRPPRDDPMTTSPPSALQLVQANSLPALVQAEIEQLVLRGEIGVGQRLNEVELAERFGTSRGPVREALRALEECGLVRSEKNRGVFVREISVAEADEIYDVREVLDELIGRRLAQHITPPQLEALKALLAEMDDATAAQDVKRYHALNLEFHDALVDFAGNARLAETYRKLTKELLLFRLRGLQDGGGFAVSNAEHKAVVKAIASRDPDRAGRVLRAHAADSRDRMHKAAAVHGRGPATDAHRSPEPAPRAGSSSKDKPARSAGGTTKEPS
jgi:phosphonate utilization transcriptional regulator